jgi:hypothetical protein
VPGRPTHMLIGASVAALLSSCGPGAPYVQIDGSTTFTLYRNSSTSNGLTMRIHVATLDTAEGADYNAGSCAELARAMNQRHAAFQGGEPTQTWWCEPGRFHSG